MNIFCLAIENAFYEKHDKNALLRQKPYTGYKIAGVWFGLVTKHNDAKIAEQNHVAQQRPNNTKKPHTGWGKRLLRTYKVVIYKNMLATATKLQFC